jgi:outer membrane protein OmpA-like peptidoglycan-associated protein
VYDGIVPRAEFNKFSNKIRHTQGAMSFQSDDPVQLYLLKPEKTVEIYVMLQTNSAGGKIQIVQKGEFKQTIKSIEADDIQKQIDENGKAVLSINFDIDRATLKEDGQQVVAEIAKLLAENVDLKVSIEGHTDNSGTPARNRSLSAERARTVLNKLVQTGIEASRLKVAGFGADKPLVANDSEDNKALNRRVELVKF